MLTAPSSCSLPRSFFSQTRSRHYFVLPALIRLSRMGTGPVISSFFRSCCCRMDTVGLGHFWTKCFTGTIGESYLKCCLCWNSALNCKQGWEGIAWRIYRIHGITGSSDSSFPARHCLLYELLGPLTKSDLLTQMNNNNSNNCSHLAIVQWIPYHSILGCFTKKSRMTPVHMTGKKAQT